MPKRQRDETLDLINDLPSPGSDDLVPRFVDDQSHSLKYVQTTEGATPQKTVMKCSLPPHSETLSFSTFEDFEVHYAKAHANRCHECRKNFPTEHFLGLHIEENHDPLIQARRAKGDKTVSIIVCH